MSSVISVRTTEKDKENMEKLSAMTGITSKRKLISYAIASCINSGGIPEERSTVKDNSIHLWEENLRSKVQLLIVDHPKILEIQG